MIAIYKAEQEAGIAQSIRENMSVAYISLLKHDSSPRKLDQNALDKLATLSAKASINDADLYFTKSILASSNWNKNDDVFDRGELWLARATPIHKPNNLGHNQTNIVGHMVDCFAVDDDYNAISEDITVDELPELYHLLDSSVIYRHWDDKARKEEIETLIAQIEAEEMFVSMECVFKGFDYAVITPEGEEKCIARTQNTAFLSKHLRRYGGTGTYQGYTIGRLLRNITFSGKGYVTKPANTNSVIIIGENEKSFASKVQINGLKQESGVLLSDMQTSAQIQMENKKMPETNQYLEQQVAELKDTLKAAQASNKELNDKLAQAGVAQHEAVVAELNAKLAKANELSESFKTEVATLKAGIEQKSQELETVKSEKTAIAANLESIKAEQTKASRVSSLISKGLEQVKAEEMVAKFASLSDEQFVAIAEAIEAASAKKADDCKKDDKKDAKAEDDEDAAASDKGGEKAAASADLDNVKKDKDVALSATADNTDKTETVRAELADFIGKKLNKKTKGE